MSLKNGFYQGKYVEEKPTEVTLILGCCSDGRESACNMGDLGCTPGSGKIHAGGNGYPLQHSCLKKPLDTEAW